MMENITYFVRFLVLVASILLDSFVIWWILYSVLKNPSMSMKNRFSRGANVFWKVALFKKLPKENTVSLKSTIVFFVFLCAVSAIATCWGVGGCKKFFVQRYNEQLGAVSFFMINPGFAEWIDYNYVENVVEELNKYSLGEGSGSQMESKIWKYCDKNANSDVQAKEWHRFVDELSAASPAQIVRLDVRGGFTSKKTVAQGSRSFYVTLNQLDSLYKFYRGQGAKSCNLNFSPIPSAKNEKEATCHFENDGFRFLFSGVTLDTLALRKKLDLYKKMCYQFK